MKTEKNEVNNSEKKLKLPFIFKVGVAFIIISPLRYLILLGIPFLPYSAGVKMGVGSAIFVVAEVLFWIGVFIVGEEVVRKYRDYLKFVNIVHHTKKFFGKKKKSKEGACERKDR